MCVCTWIEEIFVGEETDSGHLGAFSVFLQLHCGRVFMLKLTTPTTIRRRSYDYDRIRVLTLGVGRINCSAVGGLLAVGAGLWVPRGVCGACAHDAAIQALVSLAE